VREIMRKNKLITGGLFALLLLWILYYLWFVMFNFRFAEVSQEGSLAKVYKSGLIAPDKISNFIEKEKIKTVINLLDPTVQDKLNPASQKQINDEARAITEYNDKNNASVQHINIPSGQVPTNKTLSAFFKVLDDKDNYPVLIHCYHGTGRAEMYSALYRIEYENMKNEDARSKTRVIVEGLGYKSSFGEGRKKGDFLINYKPRNATDSTLESIK